MADPIGEHQQFMMLRTTMREKIFEYLEKRPRAAAWRMQLPELVQRLEEILYIKFPSRNDYSNMMEGPIEPPLFFAVEILHAFTRQIQQNRQMATQTASSGTQTQDVNRGDLSEQSAPLLADKQNNNTDVQNNNADVQNNNVGGMLQDVNHGDLSEQSASLPTDVQNNNADVQNNNADEPDRTE